MGRVTRDLLQDIHVGKERQAVDGDIDHAGAVSFLAMGLVNFRKAQRDLVHRVGFQTRERVLNPTCKALRLENRFGIRIRVGDIHVVAVDSLLVGLEESWQGYVGSGVNKVVRNVRRHWEGNGRLCRHDNRWHIRGLIGR